ncbi:MAG: cobyrinate a,c-diamide synthase [Candidatus Ornithomonoglobus sp.]
MKSNIPRIMIASAMSGGGKTTAVCSLLKILQDGGHKTAPFKCGPDYIDPMYHRAACGRQGVNLDLFFSSCEELKTVFAENAKESDIAVIEGVMGYYDGRSMDNAAASSYDTARTLDCPVALILPARGMAYTVIPLIKGLVGQFENSRIAAVILNNVTKMTYTQLKPVIERETGIKAAGYIPRLEETLKSRHLGLVTPEETEDSEALISDTARMISETVDIDLLLELAEDADDIEYTPDKKTECGSVKIGVAYDKAFCFYYKDNMDILKKYGAEPVMFSPLKDKALPEGICGLVLGGGYPEVYAKELSKNTELLRDIKNKLNNNMPCLAECGGYMYLHSELEGEDGIIYKMADVIRARAFKTDKLVRFGYIDITGGSITGAVKAHEFHYWDSTDNGRSCMAVKPGGKRSWECVHADGNLFAGFPHLYYRSNENFVKLFTDRCIEYERSIKCLNL